MLSALPSALPRGAALDAPPPLAPDVDLTAGDRSHVAEGCASAEGQNAPRGHKPKKKPQEVALSLREKKSASSTSKAIRQMTEQTETLEAELSKLAAEKAQVEADLAASANRARELQAQLPQKARTPPSPKTLRRFEDRRSPLMFSLRGRRWS